MSLFSKRLMKWREPNAYVRKNANIVVLIVVICLIFIIPAAVIMFNSKLHSGKNSQFAFFFFLVAGLASFGNVLFGPGSVVCLKEDRITKSTIRHLDRSLYKNIECCNVHSESYNDIQFSVLKFSIKKGLPPGLDVEEVAVPNDVNLEQVLKILRDKGVNVIEASLPS